MKLRVLATMALAFLPSIAWRIRASARDSSSTDLG
jgi:hypothetical protein